MSLPLVMTPGKTGGSTPGLEFLSFFYSFGSHSRVILGLVWTCALIFLKGHIVIVGNTSTN